MVYVTHDQTEALTFADKVVVMYEGEIVQIGTPAELFEKPSHTFVGYFIGSPGMNLMPAEIDAARGADRRPQSITLCNAPTTGTGWRDRSSASAPNSCVSPPGTACRLPITQGRRYRPRRRSCAPIRRQA